MAPSMPVSPVSPRSSNKDIRQFLIHYLQKADEELSHERAAEIAKKFVGDGQDAFDTNLRDWINLIGNKYGQLVYQRLWQVKQQYVDKDTIWPILRHIYRIFLLLVLVRTGRSFFEKEAFAIDGAWNIVAFIYFCVYGFAYIITSAKHIDENPSWPEYFKIKPRGRDQQSWLSSLGYGDERAG